MSDQLSRRELLKAAGIVSAAAIVRVPPALAAAETLTSSEYETIEAIVARIIPSDENGPGAKEAQAARYIDRALGGALESARPTYSAGLAAVNVYAQASKGAPFGKLSAMDQDAVLTDMQENRATGFNPDSASFFNLLRAHTIQGTFSDPFYGGNANFAGWDLIGYPGVRTAVPADLQRIDAKPTPNHRSAYDFGMFSKGEE
jgi:gluconate 2-dehydrogenase gamma chain